MSKVIGRPRITPIIRFKEFVKFGDEGECHLWLGGTTTAGYGSFHDGNKNVSAHRWYYEQVNNITIPEGIVCCHTCDNRRCVNPKHIFLGLPLDNTTDCMNKGRLARGEKIQTSKLTSVQVIAIKEALAAGHKVRAIAKYFKMAKSTIYALRRGESWSHIHSVKDYKPLTT